MNKPRLVTFAVLGLVLAYAIVRYIGFGTVAPAQLPVFIVNKAFAVASIALIAIALAIGPLVRMRAIRAGWMADRKCFGVNGFVIGAMHSVLTIAMLSPLSYGKLHDKAGKLTFEGGLAVLGGVLTLFALVVPAITSAKLVRESMTAESWRRAQKLGITALALAIAHVAVLGWRTWLTPETWPGSLPPLTIWAIAAGVLTFAIRGTAVAFRALRRPPARQFPAYDQHLISSQG